MKIQTTGYRGYQGAYYVMLDLQRLGLPHVIIFYVSVLYNAQSCCKALGVIIESSLDPTVEIQSADRVTNSEIFSKQYTPR
jgi:hypothetical protein